MTQSLEEAVRTLQGMGFMRNDALEALKKFNNSVEASLEWLLVSRPSPVKSGSYLTDHVESLHGVISSPINIPASDSHSSSSSSSALYGESFKSPPASFLDRNSNSAHHIDTTTPVSVSLESDSFTPLWQDKDDRQLRMAIQKSLQDQEGKDLTTLEPIDPHKRMREKNLPVGLKNIGCTCYFNSLVQTYFMMPTFRNTILGLETNDMSSLSEQSTEYKSLKFIYTLQNLFAFLKLSQRKYVDPSNVFNSLVGIHESGIRPGTEQDPTEFNMLFMQSVSDGLAAHSKLNSKLNNVSFTIPIVPILPQNKIEEPDLIKHLFLGSSYQTVSAIEMDGSISQQKAIQQFNHIILDISYGDLYSSLDAYTAPVYIKDYITGSNYKTPTATKTETFDKLPRMLNFHLQRVNYDVQRKEAVKLNNQFSFDKVIYLDRYMHRNERETTKRREYVIKLQGQIRAMEEEVKRYDEKRGSGLSIYEQIENVSEFLRSLSHDKLANHDDICSSLASLRDQVSIRIEDLRTQIAKKKKDIASVFADMRQCEYRLHAVLVHDGRAGSGHYWAYVQDPFSQTKWYLFDDTKVEEVTEQIVWSQSMGGREGSTSSAYCLMYLHSSSPPPSSATNINFHTITGFHPSIASLRISSFHPTNNFSKSPSPPNSSSSCVTNGYNSSRSDIWKSGFSSCNLSSSPISLTSSAIQTPLSSSSSSSSSPLSTSPSPHHYSQALLSTSPPLFSARNLLIDSPVLIPVSVKSLVERDNYLFEDEVVQWDFRVIQEMDNAALLERVNSFLRKYQTKMAECVNDNEGDPRLKSFAHYLLRINSQDLMQYVIAEECYASTFPPASPSPPSSPSPSISLDFTRDRLEEDQGTDAVKKIETGLGGNVQLRLSFSQKATLLLLRKDYAQFSHVAELYLYGVHFLLDGWYRDAVVALLSAVKHEQQRKYTLAQNSRAGEILRVLPMCVRRLSSQAAELLANPQHTISSSLSYSPPLQQALELAKLVVIGACVATELRTMGTTDRPTVTSPVMHHSSITSSSSVSSAAVTSSSSSLLSPSSLSASSLSNGVSSTSCVDGMPPGDPSMESTLDLISVWENVASNCSDSSVREQCEEIITICHSRHKLMATLDTWLGDLRLPQQALSNDNLHHRHLNANLLLKKFLLSQFG